MWALGNTNYGLERLYGSWLVDAHQKIGSDLQVHHMIKYLKAWIDPTENNGSEFCLSFMWDPTDNEGCMACFNVIGFLKNGFGFPPPLNYKPPATGHWRVSKKKVPFQINTACVNCKWILNYWKFTSRMTDIFLELWFKETMFFLEPPLFHKWW